VVTTTAVDASAVVVDTWPMMRLGIARVCQIAGMRIIEQTSDPNEGVNIARARNVDLLILGFHDANHTDAVRQAKATPGGLSVLVLVRMSGRDELTSLLEAGADGLVPRNVSPEDLVDVIGKILTGERVLAPALLPALAGMRGSAVVTGDAAMPDQGGAALTTRQIEVLGHLAEGLGNDEIAKTMYISGHTVKTHLSQIYAKLDVKTRHEALARAVALGLLS
jgi:NarL family two-component system response regulator YdfI